MGQNAPEGTTSNGTLRRSIGLIAIAVSIGTFAYCAASSTATTPGEVTARVTVAGTAKGGAAGSDGVVTQADGVLPAGVTVFDDNYPGIANLEPSLREALHAAARAAAHDGVRFSVHSAWRSADYQRQLIREAIRKYGSKKKAARWVATVGTSAHVAGKAIDLTTAASSWLAKHGAAHGLCRIYRNEPWHYELRPAAVGRGCPRQYADPTKDPRMNALAE